MAGWKRFLFYFANLMQSFIIEKNDSFGCKKKKIKQGHFEF